MARGPRLISALVASAAAVVVMAQGATAATLVGDYQFQGTRASSGLGPALADVNPGNSFQTDTVMGEQRQVLAFPAGAGLNMSPMGIGAGADDYSVVTTFRFDDVDSYGRIVDATNGTSDTGLYTSGGGLYLVNVTGHSSTAEPLANNTYATVALVVAGLPDGTRAYVNGTWIVQMSSPMDVSSNNLRFFIDNTSGGATNENSAGAVSCIRVFLGALTADEISAIGASPRCGAPGPPVAAKKKCKKHKKKHRSAASAKKKKCKKKRKR